MHFIAIIVALLVCISASTAIDVTIYYESLCPGCNTFLIEQLQPTVAILYKLNEKISMPNVKLVPYGNARLNVSTQQVDCPHGVSECQGNRISACAITLYPDFKSHWPFILCMEEKYPYQSTSMKECSKEHNLDYKLIETCATIEEGEEDILNIMREETPAHSHVPWVVVDEKVIHDLSKFQSTLLKHHISHTTTAISTTTTTTTNEGATHSDKNQFQHFCYNHAYLSSHDVESNHIIDHFNYFTNTFHKTYNNDGTAITRHHALYNFHQSMLRISARNNPASGITKFSDMSTKDFYNSMLTLQIEKKPVSTTTTTTTTTAIPYHEHDSACLACDRFPSHSNVDLMLNTTVATDGGFDWVGKGAVTEVKNQGMCGSCWAFGTVGTIEGSYFLSGNNLTSMSTQQLVSCDHKVDLGCSGGLPDYAFEYIERHGGIVSDETYPYTSGADGNNGKCMKSVVKGSQITDVAYFTQVSNDRFGEKKIESALIRLGPLTMGINASTMQDYHSGVDDPGFDCLDERVYLDHSTLVVGFGVDEVTGVAYWKIKNSWDTDWGEDGYYRIRKGVNACGVALDVMHAMTQDIKSDVSATHAEEEETLIHNFDYHLRGEERIQ